MNGQAVRKVVIAGGGTAGWCAAAALSKTLGKLVEITLIESDDIGTIGVGESTIPTVRTFHDILGIDERALLRATNATFKLGISFENWAREGDHYFHAFGTIGRSPWMVPFHHLWLQARAEGYGGDLGDYCLELKAAEAGKFTKGDNGPLNYAYHLDASLYGQFLRRMSEAAGVRRMEGKITRVDQDAQTGFITAVALEAGEVIPGDLFIDCTGFRGLLIEQTLKTGWEDWGHWLPTDRALAVQTESAGELMPYTRAIAHDAGWRWRIPLQNRVGNGLVYCSRYLSDDEAYGRLKAGLDAPALFEPRVVKYATGRRLKTWNKNCLAFGLSSGFIEPLESTSIHLFHLSITRLIQMFPSGGITDALVDRYNEMARSELEMVRDFVVLHYKATERDDSAFWRDRRDMAIPQTLADRIALFVESGHAYQNAGDLFRVDSWVQVLLGQRQVPKTWHMAGSLIDREQSRRGMDGLRANIARTVAAMPSQTQFIAQYLAERPMAQPA
ncbi:tryptophan halogenase family protein [Asticcacaulis taihuensis]|uniref:tryptophan halogenase family protein n=1 Tax=Asticcacaulis taihuensis TaxID=260084 RepID=UPI0026F3414D|nr:tryptophan halogenase family protein [Asticcacaulis taihuensis]